MFLAIKTRNTGELLRANVPYIVSRMSIRVVYLNCSYPHLGGFFNVFQLLSPSRTYLCGTGHTKDLSNDYHNIVDGEREILCAHTCCVLAHFLLNDAREG